MKNKLIDLNNHLFAQMERLSDESLSGDGLTQEITRAKAISQVATQIILNGKLALDAAKSFNDGTIKMAPKMLGIESGNGDGEKV